MSEQAITTTTSFIDSSSDVVCKPPISSNSSIDSGCNLSTNESLNSGSHQFGTLSNPASTTLERQHMRQTHNDHLLMLPPQPNVQPPPPPPQSHKSFYGTCGDSTQISNNNRLPIYGHAQLITNNYDCQQQGPNKYGSHTNEPPTSPNTNNRQSIQLSPFNSTSVKAQQSIHQQIFQQSVTSQRSSTSSIESSSSTLLLMPMNVKAMLIHGLPSEEVLRNWLSSIKCDDHIENFMYHGYDMHLVTRMTPQDLAAIGCKSPALRKKLLAEIRNLNLEYEIPDFSPAANLLEWLEVLKLSSYYGVLMIEGCDTIDKACQLTWEDLEEIGITKLGHQKRFLMAINKIQRTVKQQETSLNDCAIYDVHPNHRVSLNGALTEHRSGTIGRVRSGLFQTKSGANLDHRGLPVATVTPALKHISSPVISSDKNNKQRQQVYMQLDDSTQSNDDTCHIPNGENMNSVDQSIYESSSGRRTESLNLGDLRKTTMRRNPPPLPPTRTNSLQVPSINGNTFASPNSIGGNNNNNNYVTRSLRVPKLGTLTATTNKMLASGGHIQTLSCDGQQLPISARSIYSPVREAPLPPTQQHLKQQHVIQSKIPEKIDEEISEISATSYGDESQLNNSSSPVSHLSHPDEFPPPPPCQ